MEDDPILCQQKLYVYVALCGFMWLYVAYVYMALRLCSAMMDDVIQLHKVLGCCLMNRRAYLKKTFEGNNIHVSHRKNKNDQRRKALKPTTLVRFRF